MQVNENRLDTILQNFVESFNDCAELLKKWLMGE